MNAAPKTPVIVQGEASESDDDTAPPAVQAVNKLRSPAPKEQVPVATHYVSLFMIWFFNVPDSFF